MIDYHLMISLLRLHAGISNIYSSCLVLQSSSSANYLILLTSPSLNCLILYRELNTWFRKDLKDTMCCYVLPWWTVVCSSRTFNFIRHKMNYNFTDNKKNIIFNAWWTANQNVFTCFDWLLMAGLSSWVHLELGEGPTVNGSPLNCQFWKHFKKWLSSGAWITFFAPKVF